MPKEEFASRDYYDVWLPMLSPSQELVAEAKAAQTEAEWKTFSRAYLKEMAAPDTSRVLDTLAALSHTANFAVGCYCENESRCHRSLLRGFLRSVARSSGRRPAPRRQMRSLADPTGYFCLPWPRRAAGSKP
ncbi:DUF488 domain-containing protein [Rhizobium yanglingense]